jgi:hypothetical protein
MRFMLHQILSSFCLEFYDSVNSVHWRNPPLKLLWFGSSGVRLSWSCTSVSVGTWWRFKCVQAACGWSLWYIGGILLLNFFVSVVVLRHGFHAASTLSLFSFLGVCDSVNSVHGRNPQYVGVLWENRESGELSLYRWRRKSFNLWDETDIASVFLKNQTTVSFGVILRIQSFHAGRKLGGMTYLFSRFKLKCSLAYPP